MQQDSWWPPKTEKSVNDFKRLDKLAEEIYRTESHDLNLISELVGLAIRFLGRAGRAGDLDRKLTNYKKLERESSKTKVMNEMHRLIYGLQSEINNNRVTNERGGTNVQ